MTELQEEAARRSEITIETICAELDTANAVAKERGQASAMVSASALRAKLAGLMVERVEIGGPDAFSGCSLRPSWFGFERSQDALVLFLIAA